MRTKAIHLSLVLICLSACGGGGGGDTAPPVTVSPPPSQPTAAPVPAGKYSVSALPGYLLSTGDTGIYVEREQMGAGSWDRTSATAGFSAPMLQFVNDDLGNETPSAKASTTTKGFGQPLLSSANEKAPSIASLSRNWQFANLYRFGTEFVDYTAHIDIDSAGLLTGFDTNGCSFTGELKPRTDGVPLYDARIIANNCGSTLRFIEPGEYKGSAFIDGGNHLQIVGAIPAQKLGLRLDLTAR